MSALKEDNSTDNTHSSEHVEPTATEEAFNVLRESQSTTNNQEDIPLHTIIKVSESSPNSDDIILIKLTRSSESSETKNTQSSPTTIYIEAAIEDAITLDPLSHLIQRAWDQEKDFILARVQTTNPKDPLTIYYSYYSAYSINKLLFKTQPDLGVLHRVKARNPLNNETISNDIEYYAISKKESKNLASSPAQTTTDGPDPAAPTVRKFQSHVQLREKAHPASLQKSHTISVRDNHNHNLERSRSESNILKYIINLGFFSNRLAQNRPQKPNDSKVDSPQGTVYYSGHLIGTDKDFLLHSGFRQTLRKNAIEESDNYLFPLRSTQPLFPSSTNGVDVQIEQSFIDTSEMNQLTSNDNAPPSAVSTAESSFQWSRRGFRRFFSNKNILRWGLMIYIITSFIVVRQVVPPSYSLWVIIGLILFLIVIFALCIRNRAL